MTLKSSISPIQGGDRRLPLKTPFPNKPRLLAAAALLTLTIYLYLNPLSHHPFSHAPSPNQDSLESFQKCSINNLLSTGLPFLASTAPLPLSEFVSRRQRLASALAFQKIDAFIAEPGYTFQYYVNISQFDWEPWEPEERPFLMIVLPKYSSDKEEEEERNVEAETVFLVPKFEANRARLLNMPIEGDLKFVEWEEHWDPYATLLNAWPSIISSSSSSSITPESLSAPPKIIVDDEMRDFIQRGLQTTGFDVVGLSGEVEKVKQTKSPLEIDILRAVNTGTVEAIRAVRECLYPGLMESEIAEVLDETLRAVPGFEPFFDIVLFDENAANPHGGTNGSKTLQNETLVLIDVGAHYHGYSSDVTRTFFPPFLPTPLPHTPTPPSLLPKLRIYALVSTAQNASISAMLPHTPCSAIDLAARAIFSSSSSPSHQNYEPYFTHRLGHGIGIKAHESPYLNQGNTQTKVQQGMVFTSEPGIYLPPEMGGFGVRIEDVVLVAAEGEEPDVLSGRRAQGPWDP